jgi:hypothetical protein
VVFDEDSFPLAASTNLTDLDFLLESGSTVSTIGTRLPLAGSTTMTACQPAPVVPPGFEPLVAPLPTPAVPPRFLPRAASTTSAVPHVAQSSPAAPGAATPTRLRSLPLRHARLLHLVRPWMVHHLVSGRPLRSFTPSALVSPPRLRPWALLQRRLIDDLLRLYL